MHPTQTAADPQFRRERASKAARARWHTPEHAAARAAKAEEYVRNLVESAPPLTPEQIERLRALLGGA